MSSIVEAPIKRTEAEWNQFFYRIAECVASLSKDPDRRVGAVIVAPGRRQMSFGYNGFPADVEDLPSRLADRAFKLANITHAEDNALKQAPFPTADCTVYVTRFPCSECAGKLRDAGVRKVVAPSPDFDHHRWGEEWLAAHDALSAAGVIHVLP